MSEKSILEQALLQVESLEKAVKVNAKGILASTMKQELNDLLKESMEEEPKDENPFAKQEDTDDMSDESGADEVGNDDAENDDDTNLDNEIPTDTDGDDDADDTDTPEFGGEGSEDDDEDVMDMTGASDEEVLKVFKAMKPEDGIVVKRDGNKLEINTGDEEYIIKLDNVDDKEPEIGGDDSSEFSDEEGFGDEAGDENGEETVTPEDDDEDVVYEIEMGDDDDDQLNEGDQKFGHRKATKVKTVEVGEEEDEDVTEEDVEEGDAKFGHRKAFKVKTVEVGEGDQKFGHRKATKVKTVEVGEGEEEDVDEGDKKFGHRKSSKVKTVEVGEGDQKFGHRKAVKVKTVEVGEEDESTEEETTEAARTKWNPHGDKGGMNRAGLKSKKLFKAGSGVSLQEQVEILKKQNGEYKKALILFKDKLNEVAVFSGSLAYGVRLFTEHSTTKQEKMNILKRFDSCSTMNESENLYKTIASELGSKKPVTETVVDKISNTPTTSSTEVLSEAKAYENPQFKRMKELMGKIK